MPENPATPPEAALPVKGLALRTGVFVWIDRPWSEHPFLRNRFLIKTERQLKELRQIGPDDVYWLPALSERQPIAEGDSSAQSHPPPPTPEELAAQAEHAAREQARLDAAEALRVRAERARRQRAISAKAQREWEQASRLTKKALQGLSTNPRQFGGQLRDFAQSTVETIAGGSALLQLIERRQGEGLQFHALNCMTLSMFLAKSLGLSKQEIADIALGAMAHDVGKTLISTEILREARRNRSDEATYRTHCALGLELAIESGVFSDAAMAIVRDHHEMLDGSGFPAQRPAASIGLPTRIVAVANRYDRLCCPESPDKDPLLPAEALRKMWREEQAKFDPGVLAALVRLLGVYPPGTILKLGDGRWALSVSPGSKSLKPKIMLHDPVIQADEAEVFDLAETEGIVIEKAVHPREIPKEILAWFNPRERLSYFFTDEQAG